MYRTTSAMLAIRCSAMSARETTLTAWGRSRRGVLVFGAEDTDGVYATAETLTASCRPAICSVKVSLDSLAGLNSMRCTTSVKPAITMCRVCTPGTSASSNSPR